MGIFTTSPSFPTFLILLLTSSTLNTKSSSFTNSFVYVGCTQVRYNTGTPYESNVNSILTSLVNSAASSNFNNFKISLPGSTQNDIVYGLFQCRGDLTSSDCWDCVIHAVSQIGNLCPSTSGGALQLDGCFIKYDNNSFLGVEDKSVVKKKCGPSDRYDTNMLTRRDTVMDYIGSVSGYFRVGGSGKVQGVAQCVQDLSLGGCSDCLSEAIGRLKSECQTSVWGDMYLGKCYVRYSEGGHSSSMEHNKNDDMEKTLAIIIGLIAVVAVIVVLLSALNKLCETKGSK